ncbi:two-component system regulatory protein YycI [Salinibacillus xinjiangensis]|uniref:Regulatory protein YycH-like domain-containing protein n=1 Tax=Salinibacillus xinjiangensis TaxID=1229268 RepID=A0A6G1XB16_9BACI|nr:two-component system regulatory protein YycI [Salinibacillus xinjiangensis]MRG87978.1 hypothetical protein [Salinibacillus xinjiangensis]
MKWGQIKTIFILCFLVLDIFLLTQYMEKNQEPGEFKDQETSSFDDEMKRKNINLDNIPTEAGPSAFIQANRYKFTEEDIKQLKNQEANTQNDFLVSKFEEPIPIPSGLSEEDINAFLSKNILYGDQYTFWNWNEEKNILLFFQTYNGNTIYYNKGGMLMIFLNEDGEMDSYAQTMLTDIELGEEKEVSQPKATIKVLNNNDNLYTNDEITDMKLGYHTLVPFESGLQVFVPTWKISINDNRTYFVNAIGAQIISRDETTFIEEIIDSVQVNESNSGSEES